MTAPSNITASLSCRIFWTRTAASPPCWAPPTPSSRFPTSVGLQPTGLDGIVGLGPLGPGSGNFVLKASGADRFSVRKSGRTPARDHPLRHSQLSAFRGIAGLSRFRRSGAIPACSSRRAPMSATFCITASPRPPTSAMSLMACRPKAPGMSAQPHDPLWRAVSGRRHADRSTSSLVLPTVDWRAGQSQSQSALHDPGQTCQTSATPLTIADNGSKHGWNYGLYVQDEWKIVGQSDHQLRPAL